MSELYWCEKIHESWPLDWVDYTLL